MGGESQDEEGRHPRRRRTDINEKKIMDRIRMAASELGIGTPNSDTGLLAAVMLHHLLDCKGVRKTSEAKLQENTDATLETKRDIGEMKPKVDEMHDLLKSQLQAQKDRAELRRLAKVALNGIASLASDRRTAWPLWIILGWIAAGTGTHYGVWAKVAAYLLDHWP